MPGQQVLRFPAAVLRGFDLLATLLQQPGTDTASIDCGSHGFGIATAGHLGPDTRDKVRLLDRLGLAGQSPLLVGRLLHAHLLHHTLPQSVGIVGVGCLKGGQIGRPRIDGSGVPPRGCSAGGSPRGGPTPSATPSAALPTTTSSSHRACSPAAPAPATPPTTTSSATTLVMGQGGLGQATQGRESPHRQGLPNAPLAPQTLGHDAAPL